MKTIVSSDTMEIPDGVKIKVHAKVIEVEGPRGKLTRNFKHLNLDFQLLKDETTGKRTLKIEAWFGSRKTSAAIRTALSHVENLITGVTKGYRYKMRFVYAHFPINASITNSNRSIEIRNFLGEKKVLFLSHKHSLSLICFALLCLAFHSVDSIPLYMCIYGASGSESGYAWGCDNSSIWEGEGWACFGWKWYRACFTLSCSYQPSMLLWTLITINVCCVCV